MDKGKSERRSFLKYLLSVVAFGLTFLFSFKKDEGFKVGKLKVNSLGTSKAYGVCGIAVNCAGGGGQCGIAVNCAGGGGRCGIAVNCAGGQGDPPPGGGRGQCGIAVNCAGGGGQCGIAVNCAGGGGVCGIAVNCSGS